MIKSKTTIKKVVIFLSLISVVNIFSCCGKKEENIREVKIVEVISDFGPADVLPEYWVQLREEIGPGFELPEGAIVPENF